MQNEPLKTSPYHLPLSNSLDQGPSQKSHSGLGIASFVMSLVCGAALFFIIVLAALWASSPEGLDENSPKAVLSGLIMIALVGGDLLAFALGVAGCIQKEKKRVFAVLGMLVSILTVLLFIGLMIIGLAFQ